MQSSKVVVSQSDRTLARQLEFQLRAHFHRVERTETVEDLRQKVARYAARLVVVDLETIGISGLRALCSEFADVPVVCTHHSPDTELYLAAIAAGASECCHPSEIPAMLAALRHVPPHPRTAAA